MATGDTTQPSGGAHWRQFRLLQEAMDAAIARRYAEIGLDGIKPSFVPELIGLHQRGSMTITELAEFVRRTHSAMSQKVAAMRAAGLVQTATGVDARSKRVSLTQRAAAVVELLVAEYRAADEAIAEIESEIPYPLGRAIADVREALRRKSFHDRIAERVTRAARTD